MRYGLIVFLVVAIVTAKSDKLIYQEHSLLFCLKPDYPTLDIDNISGNISTGINELDGFIIANGVVKLSSWISFAEKKDHDGNIYLNRIYRVHFSSNRDKSIEVNRFDLQILSCVYSVEFDFIRKPDFTPNDPYYGQQWYLPQIGANLAWNNWNPNGGNTPSGEEVLLASVDTGVDWDHVDLRNNLWQNLNEDADGDGHTIEYSGGQWILDPGDLNGVDDDDWDNNSTTFVDDLIGWDLSGWSGTQDNNPQPRPGANNYGTWAHGTHVAGLLSSSTHNNTGIASTAFDCRIMSVKVSTGDQSYPYITDGYPGILYAAKAGYHSGSYTIINNSWGGNGYSSYEQSVINICHSTYGAIIFAAAGNGEDDGWGEDYNPHYPASYDNVISVTALGTGDYWNHWATYHETVDLAAPGENIRSCVIGNNYSSWDGTSMATPIAASCAGLMRIYYPGITNVQIETMLLASADPVIYNINTESYLDDRLGRGRVDIEKALEVGLFPSMEFVDLDITILDGEDDLIHPGESIELRTILYNNETWGEAIGLIGELSAASNAFVIQSHSNFGNVSPGDATLNIEDPFIVQFPVGIPPGEIDFILSLFSNMDDYMEYTTQLSFTINVESGVSQVEVSIPYSNGWNLVGLPLNQYELNYLELFPNAIEGTLYGFESNYISEVSLVPGSGYWLRFEESGNQEVIGEPIENLTINLDENWNLISGLSVPIPVEIISDESNIIVPGTIYGFHNSYFSAEYIIPGSGYWIRSLSDGQITLNSANRTSILKIRDNTAMANRLIFENARGTTQTLFFGNKIAENNSLSFSLPPQPPSALDVFDVRFTGDFVASKIGGQIEIINSYYPVNIEIDLKDESNWQLILSEDKRAILLSDFNHNSIQLNSSLITLLRDDNNTSNLTNKFEFSAYPNPFNPITTLSYELPIQMFVSIKIYNLMGNEVTILVNDHMSSGPHEIIWNTKNISSSIVGTGVYFATIETEYFSKTQKLVFIK
tara:strand:- start:2105 stop:5083 length:2979 start_codon:yes stop_codon:yes gene_type:complete